MPGIELTLHAAVLIAALLQAATGIGVGVIAGPVILLVLGSGAAVQVTILVSLVIAVVLAPSVHRDVDRTLLIRFLIGTVAGLPLGILVFRLINVDTLKLLAAFAVLFMAIYATGLLSRLTRAKNDRPASRRPWHRRYLRCHERLSGHAGSGGAARMAALAQSKDTIRATILVMFVFSYSAAIGFQAVFVGVTGETLTLTATLVPATLIGLVLGKVSVKWISERLFRQMIVGLLLATAFSLFAGSFGLIQGRL